MAPAAPPPPPRATSSPAPTLSRPSTPQLAALASSNPLGASIGPGTANAKRGGKGELLDLRALMNDLGVLNTSAGEGLLVGDKIDAFAPTIASTTTNTYAPQPRIYTLTDLSHLDSPEKEIDRDTAARLADEWVEATARILKRAEGELESGRGRKVERAQEVERWAGEVERGLKEVVA
ncbi:hypothetical protein JCM11251_007287 [Rhodosporidiobolus azoricus]